MKNLLLKNKYSNFFLIFVVVATTIYLSIFGLFNTERATKFLNANNYNTQSVLSHIKHISSTPHSVGSPGHNKVANYIQKELESFNLTYEIQEDTVVNFFNKIPIIAPVKNIVTILPSEKKDADSVLFIAHYDSSPNSFGANDNSVAVAALLETIKVLLKERTPRKNNLIFLFNDAEEVGLHGIKTFLENHPLSQSINLAINFEARGSSGPTLMFQVSPRSKQFLKHLSEAPLMQADSAMNFLYTLSPNKTDLSEVFARGIAGVNFAYIENANAYHNPLDNFESINQKSIINHSSIALFLSNLVANMDLTNLKFFQQNTLYFNFGSFGIFTISPALILILFCITLGNFIFIGKGLKTNYQWRVSNFLKSFGYYFIFLFSFLLVLVPTHLFIKLKYPSMIFTSRALSLFCVAVTLIGLTILFFQKKSSEKYGFYFGAIALWVLLSGITIIKIREVSHFFVLPVFISSTLTLLIFKIKHRNEKMEVDHLVIPIINLVGTCLILMITLPLFRHIYALSGIGAPLILFSIIMLLIGLCVPTLDIMTGCIPKKQIGIWVCLTTIFAGGLFFSIISSDTESSFLSYYQSVDGEIAGFIVDKNIHHDLLEKLATVHSSGSQASVLPLTIQNLLKPEKNKSFIQIPGIVSNPKIAHKIFQNGDGYRIELDFPDKTQRAMLFLDKNHSVTTISHSKVNKNLITENSLPILIYTPSKEVFTIKSKERPKITIFYEFSNLPLGLSQYVLQEKFYNSFPSSHLKDFLHTNVSLISQEI